MYTEKTNHVGDTDQHYRNLVSNSWAGDELREVNGGLVERTVAKHGAITVNLFHSLHP